MSLARGVPVHGEFSSSDASALTEANSRILLYGAGSTTAATLTSTDYVVISSLVIVAGAALTVTVYDGSDATVGAGEVVCKGNLAANGVVAHTLPVPHTCQAGTWPKVKTSGAGQVDVTLQGYITTLPG